MLMQRDWSGYSGRILEIDLSRKSSTVKELDLEFARRYIGGRGFTARILWDHVGPDIDPLDEGNRLIFATGPLSGTILPSSSRLTIAAKSPISNIIGDSNSGGYWAPELKYAGYDAIVFSGKAVSPVYILIDDDIVQIRDAKELWGKNIPEAETVIKRETGDPDVKIASIGPAGENLVRFACIVTDSFGASSRGGMGAVMGSKNLKAVAVSGSKGIRIADPKLTKQVVDEYLETLAGDKWIDSLTKMGTLNLLYHRTMHGIHQVRNSQEGIIDDFEKVKPEVFRYQYQGKAIGCMGCSIRCRRYSKIPGGVLGSNLAKGPEYVIVNSLGMKTAVADPETILKANALCDMLGLDGEAAGSVIGLAMELYERGIIDKESTGGIELRFGDAKTLLELIPMIAQRLGFGDSLAEGAWRFADKFGAGYYANVIKGMDVEGGDPRDHITRALCYALSTRGSCHLRGWPYIDEFITPEQAEKWFGTPKVADFYSLEGKGAMICWSENLNNLADMMGVCKFAYYRSRDFLQLVNRGIRLITMAYNAVTGLDLSEEEVFRAGERVTAVERSYNFREGMRRKDDYPNERLFREPIRKGPSDGRHLSYEDYDTVLDNYYEARGCDRDTGRMLEEKLRKLDLDDIAEALSHC
jgi:aldehyde:ferredoxin oxidoreductase